MSPLWGLRVDTTPVCYTHVAPLVLGNALEPIYRGGATGSNFGYLNMRILHQLIGFVNTKISESGLKLMIQLAQLKSVILCLMLHLWAAIPVIMGGVDFAEAQRNSTGVADVLSGKAAAGFARALEPMPLQFPRDHGAHLAYQIEWWYYTGNLQADDGKAFGYQLTFFRFALTPEMPDRTSYFATNQVYMGHFAITDAAKGEYFCFERRSRGAGGLAGATGDPTYKVWLEDWSATEAEPGVMRLHVASISDLIEAEPQIGLSLNLRQTRPPILHGDRGLSQKGTELGNATYYYSLVGLETTGEITINAKTVTVSGISWMDHEFGTSFLGKGFVGWDWFSLQLEDGTALVLYCLRRSDQSCDPQTFEGTLVYPDGRQLRVRKTDFTLTYSRQWTSPESGATYPSGWHITFPELKIALQVEPLIPNQEFRASFTYWEGAVQVRGQIDGAAVNGHGYVELTGYEAD